MSKWPNKKPEKALQITDDFLVHQRLGWNACLEACTAALKEQKWPKARIKKDRLSYQFEGSYKSCEGYTEGFNACRDQFLTMINEITK